MSNEPTNVTGELISLPISIPYSLSGPSASNDTTSVPNCSDHTDNAERSPSTSSFLFGVNSMDNHQHTSETLENYIQRSPSTSSFLFGVNSMDNHQHTSETLENDILDHTFFTGNFITNLAESYYECEVQV